MKPYSAAGCVGLGLVVLILMLLVPLARSQVYSGNVVGYMNVSVRPGYNFLNVQLQATNNTIGHLIPSPPDGTRVWLWNVPDQMFDPPSVYNASSPSNKWSIDLSLPVGRGFVLYWLATNSTLTFVGEVLQGALTNFVAGSNKFTLVGSKVPQTGLLGTDLGFPPSDGDNAYFFVSSNQSFSTAFTCLSWYWFNAAGGGEPIHELGTSFFIQHPGPDKNWVRVFTVGPLTGSSPTGPRISSLSIANGIAVLKTSAGKPYNVQFSTDRVNWTTLATNQTSATWNGRLPNGRQGFFRLTQP